MRKRLLAGICAAGVFAALAAGAATAGEVKGPPGTGPRTQEQVDAARTAAPEHSNSICSYSGLNDKIPGQGRSTSSCSLLDKTSEMAGRLAFLGWRATEGAIQKIRRSWAVGPGLSAGAIAASQSACRFGSLGLVGVRCPCRGQQDGRAASPRRLDSPR
jgi:hypothetical protein